MRPLNSDVITTENNRLFAVDDYSKIQATYFATLRREGRVAADPSGWLLTYSQSEDLLRLPNVERSDFSRYYLDDGSTLGQFKVRMSGLLSAWDGSEVLPDEFTLCPSGAMASLIILGALRASAVDRILFETPCYYGTVEQAYELRFPVELVPTYRDHGYTLPELSDEIRSATKSAIWLTQPRIALGWNQPLEGVERVLLSLRNDDFLVIDEVTDQSFPAHLGRLRTSYRNANVIRIRSFTKPMGLNGFRLTAILHPPHLRTAISAAAELFGGTLDAYSLLTVDALSEDPQRLNAMLNAANRQVNDLRTKAERVARGSRITVNRLVNGYIGSMVVDMTDLGSSHEQRRIRFLEACREAKTPVILGASFYMAKDPPLEAIRLNFFMQPDQVLRGIANIVTIVA